MNQDAISKSQSTSLGQANRHNTAQPALFRICRQTRQETFRLHYQERHFSIVAESLDCAMYLLDWLDAIGEEGRQSIRHLKFHFSIGYLDPSLSFMERVHSKLSDDACVEYCGYAVKMLSVGRRFERKYPKATLALRANSMPVEHACLKFFPRMAWFGSGPKEPSDCGMQPAMFICETPRGP